MTIYHDEVSIGAAITEARLKKRWTLEFLSEKAGYTERTIRNVISGKYRKRETITDICSALDIPVPVSARQNGTVTTEEYGSYTRNSLDSFYGKYFSYRWSYDRNNVIMRTVFDVSWSIERSVATFFENQTYLNDDGVLLDFSQTGDIYSSGSTNLFHMLTIFQGRVRLITLSKTVVDALNGVVLTQSYKDFYQQPALSPILMKKITGNFADTDLSDKIGEIKPNDDDYSKIAAGLRNIEKTLIHSTIQNDRRTTHEHAMPLVPAKAANTGGNSLRRRADDSRLQRRMTDQ